MKRVLAVKILRSLLLIPLLLLASCAGVSDLSPETAYPSHDARLLFYIHSTTYIPTDIRFTISEISLESADGTLTVLANRPSSVSSKELGRGQALLTEVFARPGAYRRIRFVISSATVSRTENHANLALPPSGGEVYLPFAVNLEAGESHVVTVAWDPSSSIEKGYIFSPNFRVQPQAPSARGLLLFISNSGSNYISIVDRSLERVIAAVTVGPKPMGMALNATKDTLYVVNSGSRNISVVDTVQFNIRDTIEITTGLDPTDIVFVQDADDAIEGKLYVTNRLSNDVAVISTVSKRVLKTIPVGTRPSHIAADPHRKEVYVTNELSNNLSIISTVDDSVVSTVRVDNRPTGCAVGDNYIYVFNEGANTISVISPSTRKVVETVVVIKPPRRGIKGFNERLFVASTASDTLLFFNRNNVVTRVIRTGRGPVGLSGDEDRNRLYVTNSGADTVSIIDPIGERVVGELTVGKGPYGAVRLDK